MTIDELKRALVEVQKICAGNNYCEYCPFGYDRHNMHICRVSPKIGSEVIPAIWDIDDWKENSNG